MLAHRSNNNKYLSKHVGEKKRSKSHIELHFQVSQPENCVRGKEKKKISRIFRKTRERNSWEN